MHVRALSLVRAWHLPKKSGGAWGRGYMASVSSLKSLNGERRGKDIFISYGREEGVKVGLHVEQKLFVITD